MVSEKIDFQPDKKLPKEEQLPEAENFERFFENFLNDLLENHAEKLNEGNNGIVFRLDIEKIDAKTLDLLYRHKIDFGTEQVAKVLRFGKPGEGMKEFRLQAEAYEIIEKEKATEIAHIPRPIVCREIKISDSTRNKLQKLGVHTDGQRVEIQIMDIVHGEDLATILYKEVIRNSPSTVHLIPQLDTLHFSELHEAVSDALGFVLPGKKAQNESERIFEERRVLAMNADKIYRFLAHKNVRFHPTISRQIRACMKALHEHGIVHRDAHHRNIMIQGDYQINGKVLPKVWLIDFGASIKLHEQYSSKAMQEETSSGTVKHIDDELVARDLEIHFSKTFDQHISEEREDFLKTLSSLREKLLRSPVGSAYLEQAKKLHKKSNLELLLIKAPNPKLYTFLLLLREGISHGRITKDRVYEFLSLKKMTSIPADIRLIETFLGSLTKT